MNVKNSIVNAAQACDKGNLVSIRKGEAVTTSLKVSEVFGKPHNDVLKAIKALECSPSFRAGNFSLSFYIRQIANSKGYKRQPMYYLTRDGFTFLVMGFTGKTAAMFKEAYINAFNEMERKLREDGAAKELDRAERLLDARVESFNEKLASAVAKARHGGRSNYGSCGDLRIGISRPCGRGFAEKLDNAFRQLEIAYLDGFSFAERMRNFEDAANAVRRALAPHDGRLLF